MMDKDRIVYPEILNFIHSIRRERSGSLGEFERECRNRGLPVSTEETSDLLEIICRIKKPSKILELGTCVGFSTILMRSSCDAEITTIERYDIMYREAEENFKKFNIQNVKMLFGDAVNILPTISDKFDLIFIDAAKGQYPIFLSESLRLLNDNGIIIADNIFFNGYVADGKPDRHRNKTIVVRLNKFLSDLESNENLKTVLLPISDGVSVSYKLK